MDSHSTYLLYTLLVLKKYSHSDKLLTTTDIMEYIQEDFDLEKKLDRRTVSKHLKILKQLHLHSEDLKEPIFPYELIQEGRKYYLRSNFEQSEVKMLCDAVASSRFIPKVYSEQLIQKLGALVGQNYTAKYANRIQFKDHEEKEYNVSLFYNIEQVSEAIEQGRAIEFDYYKYNLNKELIPFNGTDCDRRKVYPYYLIWTLNHYYVMCRYEDYEKDYFLRLDKMKNIDILKQKVDPLPAEFDIHTYTRNQVFMFGGTSEPIRFRCKCSILGPVIDFFGEDVEIRPLDEEHFQVRIETSQQSIFYWLVQYAGSIDQIEPAELRERYIAQLKTALHMNEEGID